MGSSHSYQVHEFAELAGVTAKALHHYDRLGLLTPRRTEAGYRAYIELDLERLEQIVALKFLGLSLRQIKTVLERTSHGLPDALRAQRQAIEDKQELLARAVRAIRAAEESISRGQPAGSVVLRKIIEVINMQEGIELMKKYYSEEAWERHRRYYENGPSPEWLELYRNANTLLGKDPGSPEAQALADRWLKLSVRAYSGDLEVQTDSPTAWMDRENWPPAMKQRIIELNLEEVSTFLRRVALSAREKYFSKTAWTRFVELRQRDTAEDPATVSRVSRFWQARVNLFRDVEATQNEDEPAGEKGQAFAQRWIAQMEDESFGDAEIKAGLIKAWADRQNWSATLRWQAEASYMTTAERFDKAADFIDKALAACGAFHGPVR
jgi:DNA-binding transcriptional MerR regulator